jgi:hypothetical protein
MGRPAGVAIVEPITCRPRSTSAWQNPSGQLIICAPAPMISRTGGASGAPKRS